MSNTLPIHPVTGLHALGYTSRGPVWPVLGGSEDGGGDAGAGGDGSGGNAGAGENNNSNKDEKPTETVDFWKQKAREQEKRAKDNATAAKRLAELEDAQKSEAEKAADRVSKAEAEVATIPAKVAESLREHLVELHQIDKDDAELFLTGTTPEVLLKQVARLVGQSGKRQKQNNYVPREGNHSTQPGSDDAREAVQALFGE